MSDLTDDEIINVVIPCSIGIALLSCLLTIYSFKLYQDLYTEERKSVEYRKKKPLITTTYRWQQHLIAVAMLFYIIQCVTFIAQPFASDLNSWYWLFFGACIALSVAKTSQYTVFMLRLHNVYGTTHLAYKKGKL